MNIFSVFSHFSHDTSSGHLSLLVMSVSKRSFPGIRSMVHDGGFECWQTV